MIPEPVGLTLSKDSYVQLLVLPERGGTSYLRLSQNGCPITLFGTSAKWRMETLMAEFRLTEFLICEHCRGLSLTLPTAAVFR